MVTVFMGAGNQHWLDLELPSELPVSKLIPMLADAVKNEMQEMEDGKQILEVRAETGDWRKLDETKSLDDYKVMDGAYLRFRIQPENELQLIRQQQLEQMRKQRIIGSLEAFRTDY
ncbi:EsaB/YukD family protein [Thermoactinomyces daqus]|uniref:EsaB/YukD family protein n=1 Tax=Thermoactinomyces TaxID=2023 RepID=UPI002285F9A6|nr:EsaB/YukD family protein [Thermoactinomyces daqus]